ncbi:hypothetical protein FEM08_03470 [Flavobacterium gilvum]|nr:hypothetical protein FEM08_03470 [Flavobacterium gilvum]
MFNSKQQTNKTNIILNYQYTLLLPTGFLSKIFIRKKIIHKNHE